MNADDGANLTDALGDPASDRRLEVLRLVGQSGSISQAAREVGISYKAAWQAIDTLTNLSGVALVDRTVGGGGAPTGVTPLWRGRGAGGGLGAAHEHAQPVALHRAALRGACTR